MLDIVHNKLKVTAIGLEYTGEDISPELIAFDQQFKQPHTQIVGTSVRLINLDHYRQEQEQIEKNIGSCLYAREIIDYSYESAILSKHLVKEVNQNVEAYSFNTFKQISVDEYLSDPTKFYNTYWSSCSDVLNLVHHTSVDDVEEFQIPAYSYSFDTLHLEPTKAIEMMSKAYPRLKFELEYIIPEDQLAGRQVFIDGRELNVNNAFLKLPIDEFIEKHHTI